MLGSGHVVIHVCRAQQDVLSSSRGRMSLMLCEACAWTVAMLLYRLVAASAEALCVLQLAAGHHTHPSKQHTSSQVAGDRYLAVGARP